MRTSFAETDLAALPRATNGTIVRPPGVGERGPLRRKLSELQKDQLIALLRDGKGRALAISELNIPVALFRNTLEGDPESRAACNVASKAAEEQLAANAYQLASQGNIDILMKLLDRSDRGHRLKVGRIEAENDRQWRMKLVETARDQKAGYLTMVGALVPMIVEACNETVGPAEGSKIVEAVIERLVQIIDARQS